MTGYESKRAAAQDKLLDDDDTQVYQDDALTIAYQSGYYDGKKAAAQEPTKYSFKAHWEEDGCIGVVAAIERLDGGVHLLKDIIDAPQPAQEPVEVLKLALEALEASAPWVELTNEAITNDKAIADIKEALAQLAQPAPMQQEPVAWLCKPDKNGMFGLPTTDKACKDCFPVYTAPPQRPWVGLEGEEIRYLWEEATKPDRSTMTMVTSFAQAIEAALRSKNT